MGPNKQPGATTADYATGLANQFNGLAHMDSNGHSDYIDNFQVNQDNPYADALNYLKDVSAHSSQNAQDLQLYQKAMLDHQTTMRQGSGRQGTILTGEPMTPTTNFNPTSIL